MQSYRQTVRPMKQRSEEILHKWSSNLSLFLSCEQVTSLSEEVTVNTASLAQSEQARKKAETELAELREDSHSQISHLVESLEQKSKAGDWCTIYACGVCDMSTCGCSGATDTLTGGREGADKGTEKETHE